MATRDKITINAPPSVRAGRFRVEIESEPITHDFDEAALGEGPARAIAAAIAEGIRAITEPAAAATIRARRAAGILSTRLFNATGKLARGIDAIARGEAWSINAPADRLGGDREGAELLERLRELVGALRDPLGEPRVRAAIEASLERMIQVGTRRRSRG